MEKERIKSGVRVKSVRVNKEKKRCERVTKEKRKS